MSEVDGYNMALNRNRDVEKPPLGLVPRGLWVDHRIGAIQAAIARYTVAKQPIPLEWIHEYNELVNSR